MKKNHKRNVLKLILIILFLILLIKAFSNSKAKKVLEITANIKDSEKIVKDEKYIIQALNEEKNKVSIVLPNVINEKEINEYLVIEKELNNNLENNIISKENISENNLEKNIEENIINNQNNIIINNNKIDKSENINKKKLVYKRPGDKIYLTQEEIKNKSIDLEVIYQTKKVKDVVLYSKVLQNKKEDRIEKKEINNNIEEKNNLEDIEIQNDNTITLKGYMPFDAMIKVTRINNEEIYQKAENHINKNAKVKVAYDIKIVTNGKEYEPTEFDQNIQVTIKGNDIKKDDTKSYKVIHIKEDKNNKDLKKVEEIRDIEVTKDDVKFLTKEFSTYALVEEPIANNELNTNESTKETNQIKEYISKSAIITTSQIWDGKTIATAYKYGDGTEKKPYLISNGEELAFLAKQVDSGNMYENQYFQITNDIDLGNNLWNPIGDINNSFKGIFDGAGHAIVNAQINVDEIPKNTYQTYGIFGSLGGGNSKTIIRNIELSGINITINAKGKTNSEYSGGNTGGIHIGTLVGTVYKNTNILNIISKSSSIVDTDIIEINDENFHFSIGGIAGYISNEPGNNQNPTGKSSYLIKNCFSDVNIELDSKGNVINKMFYKKDGRVHYHTGGIVGTIANQDKWPQNCLYRGKIRSNGFIGPIFGALTGNTQVINSSEYSKYWNGYDAGKNIVAKNIFYSNFSANGKNFVQSVEKGESQIYINGNKDGIEKVQGINKGIYTSNMNDVLNIFNGYVNPNNKLVEWIYQNDTFIFKEKLTTKIDENPAFVFNVNINDPYNTNNYTYKWFINEVEDATISGNKYNWTPNYENDEDIKVITFDGSYFAMNNFKIKRLSVDIVFDINKQNKSVTARLEGEGLRYTNLNDYKFEWYKETIDGNVQKIEGNNSLFLNGLEEDIDYRLMATNNKIPELSTENYFTFGDRIVVYVDNVNGNNSNDGMTPLTPVKTLDIAYTKLNPNFTRNKNLIVIMGKYKNQNFLDLSENNTYKKDVTITGKYKNNDYKGELYFYSSNSSYRFLNGNTTFQFLNFNGNRESLYLYLQGFSLTVGESVTMVNYANANSNQGLIGNNAPAFHIICGWLKYDYVTLPRNNSKVLIKSGTYGRIIGGGSPGLKGAKHLEQHNSHNFMGSSIEDSFNIEITVDIQNSTTPSKYDYDINLLVGGSACGNNYSNVVENIKNGTIGRLLGGSIGDSSDRPNNWNYPINTFLGNANINISGGIIDEIYGGCLGRNMDAMAGNNQGGWWPPVTQSDIVCDSYYYGKITINMTNGEVKRNIYGAGAGGVTGYSQNSSDVYKDYGKEFKTSVNLNFFGGKIGGNIYGGGYGYTEYLNEQVTQTDGGSLYGDSNIIIAGTTNILGNVYGAGCGYDLNNKKNLANMEGNSKIVIKDTPNIQGEIFGAGQGIIGKEDIAKLVGASNIDIESDLKKSVYGGGNIAKTVGNTNLNINNGNHIADIYGGGNKGFVEGTTNINVNGGINNNIYGGGNQAGVNNTNIIANDGKVNNLYGGSNREGIVNNSKITINHGEYDNVYGGNNQGGKTITTNVNIVGSGAYNVYGGGNQAATNSTEVNVTGEVKGNVYAGGNQAEIETNTNLKIIGGIVNQDVYGGGNEGIVRKDTFVHIKNAILKRNAYAGGNGATATVFGNTNILIEGNTTNIAESVFGGGNQGQTGDKNLENSLSTVNIAAGRIGKNIYGGANTSVVYGKTLINIGIDAINQKEIEFGNLSIEGTIFGGGEANAKGDEVYDFSFISVTKGIDININGNGYNNFIIKGSIFGSGNASSTTGKSYIDIKNYGIFEKPKSNVSLQRADVVTISNSAITLAGATDRTNEYSTTYFSISRIENLKLMNNSTLFLCNGANLLKKLDSGILVNGKEEKEKVEINSDTGEIIQQNVNNRIYMLEGKNLNIATNQQVTAYGQISGMTFFGLFTNRNNPANSTGLYNKEYKNGDKITNSDAFVLNSYVIAEHMANHDMTIDGFYSNYNVEGNIKVNYIDTTPKEDVYYMWLIGEKKDVTVFDVGIIASKYATLGTYELLLQGFSKPNIKFSIAEFSASLLNGVELVEPEKINSIEQDQNLADTQYALQIKTGNTGWKNKGKTTFFSKEGGKYIGTKDYDSDNSNSTPTINISLYHAENILKAQNLGEVKIRFQALTPIDDLNYDVSYIDINITMVSKLFQDDYYEAAITPGQEFGLFTTTETVISNNSAFSTYFSLYIDKFSNNNHYRDYKTNRRVIVSRDQNQYPFVFPENTKITMLDIVTNKYYYYIVTNQDVLNNKYIYPISDFILMGSVDAKFNELEACNSYYNVQQDIVYENFIFHVNFSDTTLSNNIVNNTLMMEMQDIDQNILIGVLGIQRDSMKYSVYNNQEGIIKLKGILDKQQLYLGQKLGLDVITDFKQLIIDSKKVYDTHYFDKKLGVKISIYDSNGKRLNNDTLLGINFELDGKVYYPRIDGTTRIKIADKVTNVLAKIKMNTNQNNIIPTGEYTIKIESFGSPDGVYYGINASDAIELKVYIINSTYGLKARTSDNEKIIDNVTGKNINNTNKINIDINYSSLYKNPQIRVALYRRNYNAVVSRQYNIVDLQDYVQEELIKSKNPREYIVSVQPKLNNTQTLTLKQNLITGTYKLTYELYDGENYIGEAYEYLIIK